MLRALFAGLVLSLMLAPTPSLSQKLTPEIVNGASWDGRGNSKASIIKLQVLLSRHHASPGTIDGNFGTNTRNAISAYSEMMGRGESQDIDHDLWQSLGEQNDEPVLTTYRITAEDITGPYNSVPKDFREMAALDHLGYASIYEKIAEQFQMSEELLRRLNPNADFEQPDTELVVTNSARIKLPKVQHLQISKQQVKAFDGEKRLIAVYPATIGSDERPSPMGEYKVTAIAENPTYHYDPSLNLSNVDVREKLVLPPGPNNPVGVVWISLSAKGYGIHGTPDPENVGKTTSHGCVRLTNWDARELANKVSKATSVTIADNTQ